MESILLIMATILNKNVELESIFKNTNRTDASTLLGLTIYSIGFHGCLDES